MKRFKYIESIKTIFRTCPVYKNILPSGQCIEYLKNVRVAACLRASERDDLHRRFHSYYLPTLKFLLKEGLLLETILHNGKCFLLVEY